jgi:hypothetical protein
MPLHWNIDHDRQRVSATLLESTTEQEIYDFLGDIIAADAMPYAKLFDATRANKWIAIGRVGPIASTARLYARMRLGPIGPFAIVARGLRGRQRAKEYALLSDAVRLVRVFDKVRQAEAWLSSLGPEYKSRA